MRKISHVRAASALVALVSVAFLVPASVLWFASLFALDAPGSEGDPRAYLTMASLMAVPTLLATASIAAILAAVRPRLWMTGMAMGSLALAAVVAAILFDPFHLRHYPPPRTCFNSAYFDAAAGHVRDHRSTGNGPERMICHDMPERRPRS